MAVLYVDSAATGTNNGTSWVDALTSIEGLKGIQAAGDTVYFSHTHNETQSLAGDFALESVAASFSNPIKYLSANKDTGALTVGSITFDSDDFGGGSTATNPFYWTTGVPEEGEANIFLRLGNIFEDAGIAAGTYRNCRFTVYDAINTNGILWDNTISFVVK